MHASFFKLFEGKIRYLFNFTFQFSHFLPGLKAFLKICIHHKWRKRISLFKIKTHLNLSRLSYQSSYVLFRIAKGILLSKA